MLLPISYKAPIIMGVLGLLATVLAAAEPAVRPAAAEPTRSIRVGVSPIASIDRIPVGAGGRGPRGPRGSNKWLDQIMGSLGNSIAGGASNIQRNIIGERGLGLPRDLAMSSEK
mgnify:CR=1 FL=1